MKKDVIYFFRSNLCLNNSILCSFDCLTASYKFLKKRKKYLETINLYLLVYKDLLDMMPTTVASFMSGDTFPITEAECELEISVHLALMGYYKQAIFILRNVLELGFLSIYWNFDGKGYENIKPWVHSEKDTPFKREIYSRLRQIENIKTFDLRTNLFDLTEKLYMKLCNYSHTKGYLYSGRRLSKSNINMFTEKAFLEWMSFYKQVIEKIAIVHVLRYPVSLQYTPMDEKFGLSGPAGGFLNPYQSDRLKEIFSGSARKVLQEISDKDKEAVGLASWVNSFPDITEEQIAAQVEDEDKLDIEYQGFDRWTHNQVYLRSMLEKSKDEKGLARFDARVEKLRQWAEKKGFLTS